ncbi:T9SS type A sorting domain-containing protein [Aquimarina litoralis]|uniref:T9SS type A sorting domain-containing protein n=1 Tax=Aquimarina litoralis TaxID=584605 RepID=UPI001C58E6EF|nr:T9SS type A sorting domain-containing protein [Aquimarina litoralis]MBW1295131.1 T9SS type A sorting domain-containing protein [Aquimarina litoralis]
MKKNLLFLIITFYCVNVIFTQTSNNPIKKSTILFTQESAATPFNYNQYKADGVFWGFMPNASIASDAAMNQWVTKVESHTSNSKYYFGRGEFDWGWKWMIDFMGDPGSYWAKNLNGDDIHWGNAADSGGTYNGQVHSWMSHHGPDFLEWLKYQADRMTLAPVTHMMFDSQTSATRTLHWLGGDFSIHSMNGFRAYMKNKYTTQQLMDLGISNIDNFNYRQFLLNRGFTLQSYRNQANSIEGNIPLYKDFVYFQRQSLNDVMEELFDYIDTIRPGIDIGATTNVVEPRGYIFSDRLTYLAGEYGHPHDAATSPSTEPLLHYKAAEALDKTLIYFPYPDAFQALYNRNSPRQARAWIAQAYATGSIFTIPGRVWIGGSNTWDTGWENFADIYEFVHDHSELFDDYKAVSNVAMAYSVYASLLEGGMAGSIKARQTLDYLITRNISFDLKIFGDPDRPITPSASELAQYDVIVHDSDIQYLTSEQNSILNTSGSNIVSMDNANDILGLTSWKINVLQNNQWINYLISALPRISSEDPEAPYVLHLINRKYDASADNAQVHNGVSVQIPSAVFPKTIVAAKLHIPGEQSVDLSLQTDNSGTITLNIGTFDSCWGMVELIHDNTLSNEDITLDSETVSFYPNPANTSIHIENFTSLDISSVDIYDIQGKKIINKQLESAEIDVSVLTKGVYLLKINNNSGDSIIKKMIKN